MSQLTTDRTRALGANSKPNVYVEGGDTPYHNTRAVLSQLNLARYTNKRVLLKPNVGRIAPPGKGIITEAQVVAAAIDAFQEIGAEVVVGESPIVGVDTLEAFEAGGIRKIARERHCPLIDLNQGSYTILNVPHGEAISQLKVCEAVLSFDVLVSIPVAKMHMHTGASLSIKNMKGCLWRRSKVDLHMLPPVPDNSEKPINIAIADMSGVLHPHLSIIDATIGMEGLGPSAGDPKELGVVIAGEDPFATDAVACQLMGIDAHQIPHLKIGAERGYGIIDIDQIDINPESWEQWRVPFALPPANLSIQFPRVTVYDQNSCSACQSTLLLFLKRYRHALFDYFPPQATIQFAIGKGHTELPSETICVGNCSGSFRKTHLFIKGCPPVGSQILKAITGKPSIDYLDGHSKSSESPDSSS